jgi:hypothetical protein
MRSGLNCGTAGFTAFERRLMSDPDAHPRTVERRDLVASGLAVQESMQILVDDH